MSQWRDFEKRILHDLNLGMFCTQIPSAISQTRGGFVRKKTDFDFAACVDGKALFFDAKACGKEGFYLKDQVFNEKKIHQFNALSRAEEAGAFAGYLVWFYQKKIIAWISVQAVLNAVQLGAKALDERSVDKLKFQKDGDPINFRRLLGV